jgi:hypothetical protein
MNITYDDYLKALGLHLLAKTAADKADEYRRALEVHLGRGADEYGHISDSVHSDTDFNEALKLSGIVVDDPVVPQRRIT